MEHDLPGFRLAHAVHSDVEPTLVFFNNCRLTNVNLNQFENKHFEMVARCFTNGKTHKVLKIIVFYTPTRSASLLTLVLNFQTAITDGRRSRMSRYFCLLCN